MTDKFQVSDETSLQFAGYATSRLFEKMSFIVESKYSPHPFSLGLTLKNIETVLRHYLTMSTAFPYIQAGVHHQLIADRLRHGEEVGEKLELTAAVASFLIWDEFGGHAKILSGGSAALPDVLDTQAFHANLFKNDVRRLLGKDIKPSFCRSTLTYLAALEAGLASFDAVERVAHMVAFERHAGVMIETLWNSLRSIYNEKEHLAYFETHVGGDDPAEPYHVAMTARMIDRVVEESEINHFLEAFDEAYGLSFNWCDTIKDPGFRYEH